MLSAITAPTSARAKEVSPQVIACHGEATKRYIADIRQVSVAKNSFDEFPIVVTIFENENPRYEDYFAGCMKRWDREKAR